MRKINTSILSPDQKDFPARLKQLPQDITKLYSAGEPLKNLLESPTVGIVGSRKVSSYGRRATEYFARQLARKGVVIVSGLALGVDSIAHRTCTIEKSQTIAVLPSGLGSIYPASHRGLARQILLSNGTLVSEYEKDERPHKYFFIARNRIIAALSDVLLVTEAAENSGSLYTAEFALEMGKTVFAVPGPIDSPSSRGTNRLIKSGACVALEPQDILDDLNIHDSQETKSIKYTPENDQEARIIKVLKNGQVDASTLLEKSGLDTLTFQQQLTILEIKGVIKNSGNNTWAII